MKTRYLCIIAAISGWIAFSIVMIENIDKGVAVAYLEESQKDSFRSAALAAKLLEREWSLKTKDKILNKLLSINSEPDKYRSQDYGSSIQFGETYVLVSLKVNWTK